MYLEKFKLDGATRSSPAAGRASASPAPRRWRKPAPGSSSPTAMPEWPSKAAPA